MITQKFGHMFFQGSLAIPWGNFIAFNGALPTLCELLLFPKEIHFVP
jgi:hypothetical protein